MQATLIANNVSRKFGSFEAVSGVSLTLRPGEITALLGPNGAGKSTLFRMLARLLACNEGVISPDVRVIGMIDGIEPPNWAKPKRLLALQAEADPSFDRNFAESLLTSRQIAPDKRFGALSKGQRRWTSTVLALASSASCLLLDEPADGLDPDARQQLYHTLRKIVNERQKSVLVATHILADIGAVADHLAVMRAGRLVFRESLETLREQVSTVCLPMAEPLHERLAKDVLTSSSGATETAYVLRHRRQDRQALTALIGPHATVRPVPLDELYHCLTEAPEPVLSN